ncbi:hypothetical protein O6H91_05G096300 [Diphasiastrum complanatum]|uniref:Uncharacterized protein n=1 Tax=Diphasiastrum complanatum TaxID=34168 RepID=A0ACC2DR48_DIPCM|nr:hypothetical protein O6H91_05G096300 [Diphasiastrum complanatum]
MAQISEVVSIGGEDESDRGSRKISEKDPLMMDVVVEMSNSSGRDERGAKRARRASPSEDEPYSLSPGKFQQGGKKAKLGQERQGDTKDGLALELEATSSEQGLCPQRGESRIADESMANELEESPRAENGQQRLQPEQEKAALAASTSSTQAEEALRSNITNRKDEKGTETILLDQENTLEEADHRDGTGIELRGGGNFLHNGGGKTNKGRGEIAVRAKGTEGLDSGVEATEWTSLREDDENPVLASLIELPARNRNKVSSTSFEGSKDNQVTNTQHAMDPEENERQSRMLLKEKVAEMTAKVEEMEQQVAEVLRMRAAVMKNKMENGRPGVNLKENEKDRIGSTSKKQRQFEVARREAAHTKRMADLMRQFSTILRQITQHKWAWPFMRPVDVVALGLHDYFDVIKKPMDFGTIREKMNNPKEGAGYRNIQEICEDVRLVFSNAMTYNQEGTDVHIMAKTLSEKFEEKWKIVLEPKLHEEMIY